MATTKLSKVENDAMELAADLDAAPHISTWANWAIQEIWEDRLWPFRRRALAPINVAVNDSQVDLPSDFDQQDNFQLLTPTADAVKLWPVKEHTLKYYIPDPTSVNNGQPGTPAVYLTPIHFDGTKHILRFYPPSDKAATIGGDYYIVHPILNKADSILIPPQWDHVIVSRIVIYIKEFEDEVDIRPWERIFDKHLNKMRNMITRRTDELPGFVHEKHLKFLNRALKGVANDLDIGR